MGHYDTCHPEDFEWPEGHPNHKPKEKKMDVDHGGVPINPAAAWPFPTNEPRSARSYEEEIDSLKNKIEELVNPFIENTNVISFDVDGHRKYFKLEECAGDLDIVEVTREGFHLQRIVGINESGTLIRYPWVSGEGWKFGKNDRVKVGKDLC